MASSLAGLAAELQRVASVIVRGLAEAMEDAPAFNAHAESSGVPSLLQATVEKIRALATLEPTAETLNDAIAVIDGLVESVRISKLAEGSSGIEAATAGFEAVWQMFMPIIMVNLRRTDEVSPNWYIALMAVQILDSQLAERMPNGMILERAWVALASLWNELSTENSDKYERRMLRASLVLAGAAFYAPFVRKNKTLDFRLNPFAYLPDGYDYKFSYGWESDLPRAGSDEALALPSPERPLPVWLAQRSFSLRLEKKTTPFTLRNYSGADRPSEAGEKVNILGFTFVPIPAAAGGPSLYLQFDGAGPTWFPTPDGSKEYRLGDDWVVRTRINTDIGVMIPFRTGAIGGAGMGADLSVELLRLPEVGTPASSTTAPPSATADGGTSGGWTVHVGGVGFKAFASTSGGASGSGGENSGAAVDGATDIGVTAQISKFRVTLVPKSAVEKALVKEHLSIALDA